MADPFRTPAQRCELCDLEVGADELVALAGTPMCPSCRRGDLSRAIARLGLVLTVRDMVGGYSVIEVVRLRILDLAVRFEPDAPRGWLRRVLGASDPEVGDPAFDENVWIDPADDSFTRPTLSALRGEGVREAILALTGCGCSVELAGGTVWTRGELREQSARASATTLTVSLAAALERFARGHDGAR